MKLRDAQKTLAHYPIFTLSDLRLYFPKFHRIQLDRWADQGDLIKIRRGFYAWKEASQKYWLPLYAANRLCEPSYVSLEKALRFYNLIPEEVFQFTSVTTRKTVAFECPLGAYRYGHLKPGLFFGYRLISFEGFAVKMAEPEKAILDYLYLHPHLKSEGDFEELRLSQDVFNEIVSIEKLGDYLKAFQSPLFEKRVQILLKTLNHA